MLKESTLTIPEDFQVFLRIKPWATLFQHTSDLCLNSGQHQRLPNLIRLQSSSVLHHMACYRREIFLLVIRIYKYDYGNCYRMHSRTLYNSKAFDQNKTIHCNQSSLETCSLNECPKGEKKELKWRTLTWQFMYVFPHLLSLYLFLHHLIISIACTFLCL